VVFIVGSYTFTGGNDLSQMWINPAMNSFGAMTAPTPSLINSNGANITAGQIASFIFVQRSASQPTEVLADELRIGTSWADVTPPAGSPTRPRMKILNGPGGGTFQFGYTNNSGRSYSVYMSTNLSNWASMGAATEVSPAYYEFEATAPSNASSCFYQLRTP
jgi:hypothetical protein